MPRITAHRHAELSLERLSPLVTGYVLPFALIVYLALKGGGYDAIVRSEVGIAAWWVVLLGSVFGLLPAARIGRAAWACLGLLVAFAIWTGLGIAWSESAERSVTELARVATLGGIFVLALATQGREGLRRTVGAVALAVGFIAVLALLSRLHPQWFPDNETAAFLDETAARLNYPINYWNGLAALVAIGIPLTLAFAARAAHLVTQALATAAVPVLALVAFYTFSRGGALEIVAGLVAFVVLYPRRLELLPPLGLSAVGSGILIAAATQRDALEHGKAGEAALSQGDEMIAIVLVVCAGAALVSVGMSLAGRRELLPRPDFSPRFAAVAVAVVAVVGIGAAVAAGAPGELSDRWEEFKQPIDPGSDADRFESTSGNGRYQYWSAAADAAGEEPILGLGPGTYEYWWAREGSLPGFVTDAHSLYMETLGELGVVGLVLIGGLVVLVLGVGVRRALASDEDHRVWVAAVTAACTAFAVAAGVDWAWEVTVLPVAFLILAAALVGPGGERPELAEEAEAASRRGAIATRAGLAVLAAVSLITIAIPLAGASAVRESRALADEGHLDAALDEARAAQRLQPYAATPYLQEALILERSGNLSAAAKAAREATDREETAWRNWLVLSRIEALNGDPEAALRAYTQARELNPRSTLFNR